MKQLTIVLALIMLSACGNTPNQTDIQTDSKALNKPITADIPVMNSAGAVTEIMPVQALSNIVLTTEVKAGALQTDIMLPDGATYNQGIIITIPSGCFSNYKQFDNKIKLGIICTTMETIKVTLPLPMGVYNPIFELHNTEVVINKVENGIDYKCLPVSGNVALTIE